MADPYEGIDENGYITTGAHRSNLSAPFARAIDDAVQMCTGLLPDLHSLYVYGSVARGTARIGDSDFDLVAVFNTDPDPDASLAVSRQLSQRHASIVRDVSIAGAGMPEIHSASANGLAWRCFIRHYCICVAGDDIARTLPRCRPSAALVEGLTADTHQLLDAARDAIASTQDFAPLARSIARKLLLTGAAIVSLRTGTWTTDRERAAAALVARYPNRKEQIAQAVTWAAPRFDAAVGRTQLLHFLNDFGAWVLDELRRALVESGHRD